MSDLIHLSDRAVIEIVGDDRKKFLQGLITNDINKASEKDLIYSAMLNASGRFLYDFFIFEIGDKLFLDCYTARRDEIIQKLSFYKLRSQVVIKKNDELKVFYSASEVEDPFCFNDPRSSKLGYRVYKKLSITNHQLPITSYEFKRISLKIPESESDLTVEKSFILEFGFDDLNAIDYQKGCYVGQELTARTHYRGEIRKKLFHVVVKGLELAEKNGEITCEGKSAGIILSSVFYKNELHALALVKDSQEVDLQNLELLSHKILVID